MEEKLSKEDIIEKLGKLNEDWRVAGETLVREIELKDFTETIAKVNAIADEAEEMNHHPDLAIHDYNKLKISISTHAIGGLTQKDFKLAAKIDKILG